MFAIDIIYKTKIHYNPQCFHSETHKGFFHRVASTWMFLRNKHVVVSQYNWGILINFVKWKKHLMKRRNKINFVLLLECKISCRKQKQNLKTDNYVQCMLKQNTNILILSSSTFGNFPFFSLTQSVSSMK